MSAGGVVQNLTALVAVDMTSITVPVFFWVTDEATFYHYAPSYSGSANSPFTVLVTTGGGGWFASGMVTGTSVPGGAAQIPVQYGRVIAGSTGNRIERIYFNPGGGSSDWTSEAIS